MTETATQNMSIGLYRYMCQEIIGTEEQVKTIRMMNNIRDNLTSCNNSIAITSGSFGEGLEMRGSDLDQMCVYTCIEVPEDANINFIADTVYFTTASEDTPPSFTKLRLLHRNDKSILEVCDAFRNDYYFSNAKVEQNIVSNTLSTVHGPCVSDKHGIWDFAFCIRSKSWITRANQWITRSNNSWPGNDVKQSVLKHGVIFVPIGVQGSLHEELEWRISFSVGEKLLVYTFTHTQLLCYALMKILLKDVINIDRHCKDLLCSYFLKTVIFWISEELSASIWKPENLISSFMRCLRRLIYFVEYSVCPHYFIPKNNLFENKIKGQSQQILLNKLHILNRYGWQCIFFSGQISNFDTLAYGINKNPRFLHVRCVEALLKSMMSFADDLSWKNNLILEKGIHKVLSLKNFKIKSLYTYYISKLCCRSHQLLPFDDISDNRFIYKQYNTCVSTLLLGTRHDAVSGWLLLASFFYKTKQYKIAVYILKHCLSKCTPEKLYHRSKLSRIHKESCSLHVFRELTSVQLFKFLILGNVILSSNLLPTELRIEGKYSMRIISPVVYAQFLRFLCHYHLYNTRQCRDSLQNLQLIIKENCFISNAFQKALSYKMLGICFQLLGDTESARQVFMRSIELFPDPNLNDASRRLSLIG